MPPISLSSKYLQFPRLSLGRRASFQHSNPRPKNRMEATLNDITKPQNSEPAAQVGSAVGLSGPNQAPKHWYIAIVGNNTEKVCCERMRKLFEEWRREGKNCEAYVPIQKEMRAWRNGRRTEVGRIILPTFVFVRCTELERRKDVAYIPYVRRFFVNTAGAPVNGHRPIAIIPDRQMASLMRMVDGADSPVSISSRPLRLGERPRQRRETGGPRRQRVPRSRRQHQPRSENRHTRLRHGENRPRLAGTARGTGITPPTAATGGTRKICDIHINLYGWHSTCYIGKPQPTQQTNNHVAFINPTLPKNKKPQTVRSCRPRTGTKTTASGETPSPHQSLRQALHRNTLSDKAFSQRYVNPA